MKWKVCALLVLFDGTNRGDRRKYCCFSNKCSTVVWYMYLENKRGVGAQFVNPLKYNLWIDESQSVSDISIGRMSCHVYNISNIS